MSEVATYLKVGTTAIILAEDEDDVLGTTLLANPCLRSATSATIRMLARTVLLRSGRRATALEVQWSLLERAQKYERSHGLSAVGDAVGADIMHRWEAVLNGLESDRARAHWVDCAKERLVRGYGERHGIAPGDAPEGPRPPVPRHAGRPIARRPRVSRCWSPPTR